MRPTYGETPPAMDPTAALTILDRHAGGATCSGCGPHGCETLTVARQGIETHRAARRAATAPARTPA